MAERIAEFLHLAQEVKLNGTQLSGPPGPFLLDHCVAFFPNPSDPKVRFVVFGDREREDEVWEDLEKVQAPNWDGKSNPSIVGKFEARMMQQDLPSMILLYGASKETGEQTSSMFFPPGMTVQEALDSARLSVARYGAFGGN